MYLIGRNQILSHVTKTETTEIYKHTSPAFRSQPVILLHLTMINPFSLIEFEPRRLPLICQLFTEISVKRKGNISSLPPYCYLIPNYF